MINDVIRNRKLVHSLIDIFVFRYLETEKFRIFPNPGTLLKIVPD